MPTQVLSGWNSDMPSDVLLDSGVIYIGANVFSATEGGLKYDPNRTLRQVAFDGQRSPVVGLDRTVMFQPKISGANIQLSKERLQSMNPGMTAVTVAGGPTGATQFQAKPAGVLYASGDYLSNVRAIWQRGDGTYFQIRFPKAMVTKWSGTGTDKQEGKWDIEIEARLDMAASGVLINTEPAVAEYFAVAP